MKTVNFQYMPDAAAGGQGGSNKKPVQTKIIPQADIDFKDVSATVAEAWMINPAITLVWKKSGDFKNEVQLFGATLEGRIETGSLRPGQTLILKKLDDEIDAAVGDVKTYIEKKYKKANAIAQFARFGITKTDSGYYLGRDRNNRNQALSQMVKAIAAEGFANEEFGTAFWTGMQTSYAAALKQAGITTGDVSGKVATKNEQKKAITKVLSALLFVLRGNYPETYKEIYRQWGWKKESY